MNTKYVSITVSGLILIISFGVQAGSLFDSLKKAAGEVAEEVKKDVKYTVDQTLRNTFPAITVAGEAEKAPEGYSDEILVFGFKGCPWCVKVENLLRDNRVHYKDMDVEKSKHAKREFRKLGGGGVPVTVIGDQAIRGFSEEKIMALLKQQGFL